MRLGRKGFSLVEVIVSLAIMAIVGSAVSAFMIAGNNSYVRGNNDLTLQEEAQLTTNQMIDLIIDVQDDIDFKTTTGQRLNVDGDIDGAGVLVNTKELWLYNDEQVMMLRWQAGLDGEPGEVYLLEADNQWLDDSNNIVSKDTEGAKLKPGNPSPSATVKGSLLAQYVTDFNVTWVDDGNGKPKNNKVILNMTFEKQDKTYEVSETIKLRNSLKQYADENGAYNWITSITLEPQSAMLTQGQVFSGFKCTLTGDTGAVEEGVTWTMYRFNGTMDSATSIDPKTGKISVSKTEPIGGNGGVGIDNSVIKVIATSNADSSYTAEAWVSIKEPGITDMYIDPENAYLSLGETQVFTCVLNASQDVLDEGVEWSVTGADGGTTFSINSGGSYPGESITLNIGDYQTCGDEVITITARSKAVPARCATAQVTVSEIMGKYDVRLIAKNLTTYPLTADGKNFGYTSEIECLPAYADYLNGYPKITWEVVYPGQAGFTLDSGEDEYYDNDLSNNGMLVPKYTTQLYCGTNINTKVTVQATVQLDAKHVVVQSIDIQIPNLETSVDSEAPYIASDNFVLYRNGTIDCHIENYYEKDDDGNDKLDASGNKIAKSVIWSFQSIPDEIGDAVGFNNKGHKANLLKTLTADLSTGLKADGWFGADNVGAAAYGGKVYEDGRSWSSTSETAKTEVTISANWYIDWNKEYRLKLLARDPDTNKVVAESIVLIPKFDILFSNKEHYMYINKINNQNQDKQGYYQAYELYPYGLNTETPLDGNLRQVLYMEAKLQADDDMSSDTRIVRMGSNSETDTKINAVALKVGSDEKNQLLYLTIRDVRMPDADRTLMFIVQ